MTFLASWTARLNRTSSHSPFSSLGTLCVSHSEFNLAQYLSKFLGDSFFQYSGLTAAAASIALGESNANSNVRICLILGCVCSCCHLSRVACETSLLGVPRCSNHSRKASTSSLPDIIGVSVVVGGMFSLCPLTSSTRRFIPVIKDSGAPEGSGVCMILTMMCTSSMTW